MRGKVHQTGGKNVRHIQVKQLGCYIVHPISVKSLLILINKAGKLRKMKYSISLLEQHLDSEEEKNPAGLRIQPKAVVSENKFI